MNSRDRHNAARAQKFKALEHKPQNQSNQSYNAEPPPKSYA